MFLKLILLITVGFSGGILVAAGLFTLVTSLGIITRLAQVTRSAYLLRTYENVVIIGTLAGTLLWLYHPFIGGGVIGCTFFGFLSGIYVGCLIGAIAEILNAFPIFFRRMSLKGAAAITIVALAVGKLVGVYIQFLI